MPPASTRTRRADAARNRQLLLEAARRLIDERGPAVVMDEVARRAGVGNATLYRNFPTRGDLLAAVYANDVDELCEQGAALLREASAGDALATWLDSFVRHVAVRRPLALAATEGSEQRGELFGRWHERMASTAAQLLTRAQQAGAVRDDLSARDILALANAAAIAGTGPDDARRLLDITRRGFGGGSPFGLPAIPASAGALIFDQAGRLLILKPTYKTGWTIPGGVMEADGETPWEACRREVREECGLEVRRGRLACVDFRPARPERPGGIRFLFDCGAAEDAELAAITVQPEEIAEYRLVPLDTALELLRAPIRRRVRAAARHRRCVYLENGRPVAGVT